jgi:hypothetical protein
VNANITFHAGMMPQEAQHFSPSSDPPVYLNRLLADVFMRVIITEMPYCLNILNLWNESIMLAAITWHGTCSVMLPLHCLSGCSAPQHQQ